MNETKETPVETQWTITKDLNADTYKPPGSNCNAAGRMSSNATLTHEEIVNHPAGVKFKLFDDDSNLCYEGVMVGKDVTDGGESMFNPLEDFGEPNSACTYLEYLENRSWKIL